MFVNNNLGIARRFGQQADDYRFLQVGVDDVYLVFLTELRNRRDDKRIILVVSQVDHLGVAF